MPSVSVIIPTYNRRTLLDQTLAQLKNVIHAANTNTEVLVIDDGSSDNTLSFIKEHYPWVRLFAQENRGASYARNVGLQNVNGDYILYLDSDDLIETGFFDEKIKYLEAHPKVSGVYGPFDYFDSEEVFTEENILPRHIPYPLDGPDYEKSLERLLGGWYIHPSSVLWRKSTLLNIKGHNETLMVNQDVDLMFRILVRKHQIAGIPSPRALIRMHDGERVGGINNNPEKLTHILDLRRFFKTELDSRKMLYDNYREALARYCFNQWAAYYRSHPAIASGFLKLSEELHPALNVKGHWYFRALGKIAGKANAVKIKDQILGFK